MTACAFGVRAHSGWAALVGVAAAGGEPTLVHRCRLELANRQPAQPYHEAATLPDVRAAAALIDRAIVEAEARADAALARAIADAARGGYEVHQAALLINQARPLPPLEAILRSHPLLHTAEGELFRRALARAFQRRGVDVIACPERDVYERSGTRLGIPSAVLRRRVAAIGRSFGPPWTADQKTAFAAAWSLVQMARP